MRGAVFLDRDGTVIELVHHLTDPRDVDLIDGAGEAIKKLRKAGYPVVIITNQSVIGRGLLDEAGLALVHGEMNTQLAAKGTQVDGIYFCPLKPTQKDPAVVEDPMRKPGPGMLLQAADDLGLDLKKSWMIGDTLSDMYAGRNAGCKTALVRTGYGNRVPDPHDAIDHIAQTLADTVAIILKEDETA